MRQHALSARTQHAKAMGVVNDQPCAIAFGQSQQLGQRRDVAVH